MPVYLYNGAILLVDGQVATSENCCCNFCVPGTLIASTSGGEGTTVNVYQVPARSGLMTLSWDAFTVPDDFRIEIDGNVVFRTGPLSDRGSATICKPEGVTEVTVIVEGPGGTAWEYSLSCPSTPCDDGNGEEPPGDDEE